jgi:hypothetical protein
MKTESHAWAQLQRHAAARISPGFADRVARLARAGAEAAPTFLSYCALSAATAALCLAAVALFSPASDADGDRDTPGWQQIADEAADLAASS